MDRFEISTLRSYYGALLTQRQNDMLVMHYDEDLSFGEIANIVGISRQAVLDGINKGEKHLCEYEQKLRLVEKDRKMHAVIDTLANVDDDRAKQCAQQLRLLLEE
jgi:predicted DNA-binding protein YlxM (UPF0122 family)